MADLPTECQRLGRYLGFSGVKARIELAYSEKPASVSPDPKYD